MSDNKFKNRKIPDKQFKEQYDALRKEEYRAFLRTACQNLRMFCIVYATLFLVVHVMFLLLAGGAVNGINIKNLLISSTILSIIFCILVLIYSAVKSKYNIYNNSDD